MKFPRFFLARPSAGEERILPPEEAHHLRDVLRLDEGATIALIDGEGREFEGEVVRIRRGEVWVLVRRLLRNEPKPRFALEILLPLLKGGRTEFLVEKATELGASRIIPFVSRRTIPSPSARTSERLLKRAIQALKQSGRLWLPQLEPPAKLEEHLPRLKSSARYFAYEKGGISLSQAFSPLAEKMALATGPEGGFSEEEALLFRQFDFVPLTLGPYILRAETAALFLLSVWRYHTLSA